MHALPRISLLALLAAALPSRVLAQTVLLEGSVGSVGTGAPGVSLSRATGPASLRWLTPTRAVAVFRSGGAQLRADVDLHSPSLTAVVRPAVALQLRTRSPFHVEVRAGTTLPLRSGGTALRVELPSAFPFADALVGPAVRSTAAVPAVPDASPPCTPTELWASPRVAGPMLVTRAEPLSTAPVAGRPGWHEVWLECSGVRLRGYTWNPPTCTSHGMGGIGSIGYGAPAVERNPWVPFVLPVGARVLPRMGDGWRVEVIAPTSALRRETPAGTQVSLTLDDGTVATFTGTIEEGAAR